jgi:hypothetical protein
VIDPPHISIVLFAVACVLFAATLVATHARRVLWRLPLRLTAFAVCALLVQSSADLTLRQRPATLDQLVEAGHSASVSRLLIDAGTVRTGAGKPLRPILAIRIGGLTLPLHVHAGSYAPLGSSRLVQTGKSGCQLIDASVRCAYDAASGQLTVTYSGVSAPSVEHAAN